MTNRTLQNLSPYKADILIGIVLVLAGIKYTIGLERATDILFFDESLYLLAGVKLASRGLYCPECGPLFAPLYNLWYFALSQFAPDRIQLYWLNYKLVTIVPPVLGYILLRRNNVSMLVSAGIAVLMLTSAANLPVWPKPSHFGLMVALLFLIPASTARSFPLALLLTAAGTFLVSYARPEYFLTFCILALITMGWMVRQRKRVSRTDVAGLGVVALLALVVIAVIGLPVSGYRSLCAFGQHFSLYWVSWTGSQLHPWVDWETIMAQNFGGAHSMLEVVRNNPELFAKHVSQNFLGLMSNAGMLFPFHMFTDKYSKAALLLVMVFLFASRRDIVKRNVAQVQWFLLIAGAFILASVISILTVYPRDHYFIFPVVLLTLSLALLLSAQRTPRTPWQLKHAFILGCLILALTPSPTILGTGSRQLNVRTIQMVRAMQITKPVNILESEGGFDIYMGDNFHRIGENEKSTGFREFLASRKIGMVVVTNLLSTDVRFKPDPEWDDFLRNYEGFGFSQVVVPNSDRRVLIRKDLVQ